jgi:hypothetical protein
MQFLAKILPPDDSIEFGEDPKECHQELRRPFEGELAVKPLGSWKERICRLIQDHRDGKARTTIIERLNKTLSIHSIIVSSERVNF